MSNRASSSRGEAGRRPWYGEPWPWLLAAGPLVVVVASVCTAWLAVRSDDGLVADDYYKRGLLINRKLAHTPSVAAAPGATVRFGEGGEVRARLDEAPGAPAEVPATLRLRLVHPEHSLPEQVVTLARHANGEYLGMLDEQTPGRWIVILESDLWRLPETTVAGRLTEIRISAAPGRP
jgi:hypothetical protein